MDDNEKSNRLIEAASAILAAAPKQRLNVVVLNKVLFYLDLASLRDRAETVTCNSYIAIQQGPVVAKYPQRLIGQLEARGVAKQISEWNGAKPLVLEASPEPLRYLDGDAMSLVTAVTGYFADGTSGQASEFSHNNPGWRIAWDEYRRCGHPQAIDMPIAMQQILEDDPWMDAPLLDDEAILTIADDGDGADW